MVAWLVATTIAAVAAIICAIYFYVESNRVAQEHATLGGKYREVVAEAALTGSDVADLKAKREDTAGDTPMACPFWMWRSRNATTWLPGWPAPAPRWTRP
jgi:hypothetical protein